MRMYRLDLTSCRDPFFCSEQIVNFEQSTYLRLRESKFEHILLAADVICSYVSLCWQLHMPGLYCYWKLSNTQSLLVVKCRELTDLVVRVLPDTHAATSIIHECQTAILNAPSSLIRHRAISIMRAMASLLDAALPPQHDAGE